MTINGLPVFTVLPNWQNGMLERVSFLTDILTSETGREQRRSVRRYPRRSIEASFLRSGPDRQILDNFSIGIRKRLFYVPIWFEQFRPVGGLAPSQIGVQFPAGTLADRDFRLFDWVIITNGDPYDYEIARVTLVNHNVDVIGFTDRPERAWPAGTRIIPLRQARVMESLTSEAHSDRVSTTTIRFDIAEPETFYGPAWGHCSPLFRFVPNRADPIAIDFENDALTLDNESGIAFTFDPSERSRINERLAVHLYGRKNVAKFHRFLAAARGRAIRFWCPTFTQDVTPAEDIATGMTFDALPNGFSDYYPRPQDARRMLAFTFKDRRPPVYRLVASIAPVGVGKITAERFTFEQALPPMLAADIDRIEFVMPSRFDQDTFELQHEVDDGAAVLTSVVVRSSDIENMPPLECWLTSKLYPVAVNEGYVPTARVIGGVLYDPRIQESVTSAAAVITEGAMRATLLTYPYWPAEGMQVGKAIVSGFVFSGGVKAGDMGVDEMQTNKAQLLGGTMKKILITYDKWPVEAIALKHATITGGTLS